MAKWDNEELSWVRPDKNKIQCSKCMLREKDRLDGEIDGATLGVCEAFQFKPPMVLLDGHVVGRHGGLWQYTEGQRRGLGVSWTEPLYVIGKDRSRNALLLGTADELPVNACAAGELNFLVPPELWPHELRVRTRYRQKAVPADIRLVGGGESGMDATARMLIRFHQPQLPSAPGQLAAVFDEHGHVLAGGIICKER